MGTGFLSEETKTFDVGMKPHPRFPSQQKITIAKPLLVDLIDSVEAFLLKTNHPKVNYNIEIKSLDSTDNLYHPAPEEYANLLMKVINDKNISNRVIIQSFDPRSLKVVSEKYPSIKLSFLIDIGSNIPLHDFENTFGFKPAIISPDYSLLTKEIIDSLHQAGIEVIPWTVNDITVAKKLYEMGVDGIITDYPDRINLEAIKKQEAGIR